jgi:hypothetical protein
MLIIGGGAFGDEDLDRRTSSKVCSGSGKCRTRPILTNPDQSPINHHSITNPTIFNHQSKRPL